jgi:AraC-like DNA-binding protein
VDPDKVFASAGVDPSLLDDPDNPIPFTAVGRVINRCIEQTGRRDFGLLVGAHTGPKALGLVGLLASQSADVGSALRNMIRYFHLHDRGAVLYLNVTDGMATFGYTFTEPHVESSRQITDGAIAIACNIVRGHCGADWTPSEVLLARHRPANPAPYRRFFRAPVRFDAPENALVFPATWLQKPLPEADPLLQEVLQAELDWLDKRYGADFEAKVRRIVRTLLVSGRCSVDRVAGILSMHRRTLSRRLREEGTTFESLFAEIRYEAARHLLADTNLPIRQIAGILGYSDVTALTRAFHRWSGRSPASWRNAPRPGSGPQRS